MQAFRHSATGAYLRYQDLPGREPVRVFIHGLGCASSADFPHIAAHPLLAGHRSLLIDLLGFGFSDRPEAFGYTLEEHAQSVISLLDHLKIKGCHLIGHSMGGSVAVSLASARPDLVSRLVVLECNLRPGGGSMSLPIVAHSEAEYLRTGYQTTLETMRARAERDPAAWAAFAGAIAQAAPHGLYRSAQSLVAGTNPTWEEQLRAMALPRTFVIGERNLPYDAAEGLPDAGVKIMVVPDAGHGMMDENPEGLAQVLAEALTA
jgi:pimeloyl-ACP methyl ester carboxylesterase